MTGRTIGTRLRRATLATALATAGGCASAPARDSAPDAQLVRPGEVRPAEGGFAVARLPRVPGTRLDSATGAVAPPPAPPPTLAPDRPQPVPVPPMPISTQPPAPPEPPLVVAVRETLAGRPDAAESALKSLPPANQVLARPLLAALAAGASADLARPKAREMHRLEQELDAAQSFVAQRSPLKIVECVLASQIDGLSCYRPLPEGRAYAPGEIAEVYLEVRHAQAQLVGPEYAVDLRYSLRYADARGQAVPVESDGQSHRELTGSHRPPPTRTPQDRAHAPLRVPVPRAPGDYLLTVEVRDGNLPSSQLLVASKTLSVRVAAR